MHAISVFISGDYLQSTTVKTQ